MYFNVNFNVFFKLIKLHLLVIELYIHQNVQCNDKKLVAYVKVLVPVYINVFKTGFN